MKWYCIVFLCCLQSVVLNAMETTSKEKMEPKNKKEEEIKKKKRKKVKEVPVEDKPIISSSKKSQEIVVPGSLNYTLGKTLETDAALSKSTQQLSALAPHFEERKDSPPKKDRKEKRNSQEIRQTIIAHRAELGEFILESQEQHIIKLENKVREEMGIIDQRKKELEASLIALDRETIAEYIKMRLERVQLGSQMRELSEKMRELSEKSMELMVKQAFKQHLAEINANLTHQ